MKQLMLPIVRRVIDGDSSWIDPACDDFATDDANRLAWKAAVVVLGTGLDVEVWVDDAGRYCVNVGGVSASGRLFGDAWTYLTGVAVGARAAGVVRE